MTADRSINDVMNALIRAVPAELSSTADAAPPDLSPTSGQDWFDCTVLGRVPEPQTTDDTAPQAGD